MAVGPSGRIVIEMDPDLKQELHLALRADRTTLKEWFLQQVRAYLRDREQIQIQFDSPPGRGIS